MIASSTLSTSIGGYPASPTSLREHQTADLLRGEIVLETRSHSAWGAAVTAHMYLPLERAQVWQQVTNYSRWVQYFPDIKQSRVLELSGLSANSHKKRLYQTASKTFLFLTAQVEIYLQVVETACQQVQFQLESGSFTDFLADLRLKDFHHGTLLTYFVQATPVIPVPGIFIQQAIHMDLPTNLRTMRQAICSSEGLHLSDFC
jgi:hypothetical protein